MLLISSTHVIMKAVKSTHFATNILFVFILDVGKFSFLNTFNILIYFHFMLALLLKKEFIKYRKRYVLYSTVSSHLDRSKSFTLHPLAASSFRHQLDFSGKHSSHAEFTSEDYSLTFPPSSVARYSFKQLSELGHRGENKNVQSLKGAIQVLRDTFPGNLTNVTRHPLEMLITFVTFFRIKVSLSHPPLRYVTLEGPQMVATGDLRILCVGKYLTRFRR